MTFLGLFNAQFGASGASGMATASVPGLVSPAVAWGRTASAATATSAIWNTR